MATTKADIIFYGGDIVTMDESLMQPRDGMIGGTSNTPKVEAIAVSNGIILAVGSMHSVFRFSTPDTKVIFLNCMTLMPGFIETHQHALMCAIVHSSYTNISSAVCKSYEDVLKIMETTMGGLKEGDWGLFFGWDPELLGDLPTLSAKFLDETFSSKIPMVVVGQSGHVCWVNTPALGISEINENTENPDGGVIVKDENGQPTGQLFEGPAMTLVSENIPLLNPAEVVDAFNKQWRSYAAAGLTTVTDLAYMPSKATDQLLKNLANDPACPIRVGLYKVEHAVKDDDCGCSGNVPSSNHCANYFSHKLEKKTKEAESGSVGNYSPYLWEAGIKLVADGSPHCGTAAIREPYLNTPLTVTLGFPPAPGYGKLNMDSDALVDTVRRFHCQGKQVAIHCHGERSSEQVLKAYEAVISENGNRDIRHRMEHLGLMTVDQIARAGKLHLALSFFVDHLRFYGLVYKTDIFGDRVNRWTPLSAATESGVTWSIHQDHPTFPGTTSPFANMKTAVTRCTQDDPTTSYGPEFRVSIHEALKAYTINAAWQLHRETELGSISPGKKADLVVLSKNPYDVDPFELETIKVVETFIDGRANNFAQLQTIPKSGINVLVPNTS